MAFWRETAPVQKRSKARVVLSVGIADFNAIGELD
jgi:hypothetical protein